MKRKGLAALAVTVTVVAASLLASSPASADPGTVTCPTGTQVISYNPPLTDTVRDTDITIHRQLGPCTSSHPGLTTGTVDETFEDIPSSCNGLLLAHAFSSTIHWNTGDVSVVTWTASSTVVAGNVTTIYNGSVESGLFDGGTFQWVQVAPSAGLLLCSTTGVPSQLATLTTQITATA